MAATPGKGEGTHHAAETTSISLPPTEAHHVEHSLSEEDRAAIAALPRNSALLVAHTGPNQGARFLLDQDQAAAGRHPDADIFLDDVTVSRRHVRFTREGTGFRMTDMGSLNGSYVNNDRVDTYLLRAGDEVQIGKFRLTFYSGAK